jgi:cyanophycinase
MKSVMNGLIALAGSGEYLAVMNDVDRFLLAHSSANGRTPRVACLPTAAGREGNASVERWLRMGVAHFSALGAQVEALHVTNRTEAEDPQWAEILAQADLIYFSGGDPGYLYETMQGSRAWDAILAATARGAVYAGCSAGAMIIGEQLPDIRSLGLRNRAGFGILPKSMILPHFDRMMARVAGIVPAALRTGGTKPPGWRGILLPLIQGRLRADEYALGIDENTVLLGKLGGEWQVMGCGKVYYITHKDVKTHPAGDKVSLPGDA